MKGKKPSELLVSKRWSSAGRNPAAVCSCTKTNMDANQQLVLFKCSFICAEKAPEKEKREKEFVWIPDEASRTVSVDRKRRALRLQASCINLIH